MSTEHKPYAVDAGEGAAHWFFGSLVTVKAASEETDGHFALTEFVNPPGFATPLHVHHDEHEALYIIEGKAEVHCGSESFTVGPGSFVMLPKGIPHWYEAGAEMPLRTLVLTTGQFEKYVAACGEPAQSPELPPPGAPNMARLSAAGERFRIEVLGPPPASPMPG